MFGVPGFALKSSISLFSRKPGAGDDLAVAVPAVDRRRRRDGVAGGVDDRVVRRLIGFEARRAGPA